MTTSNKGWKPIVATPTYVTVAVPQQLDYKRTIRFRGAAARIRYGDTITINMSKEQGKLIRDAADLLGVPYVSYMRWCGLIIARALHKERTGEDIHIDF